MSFKTAETIWKDTFPRSRLCHLKPIGVGTAYVESLSGYAARLAGRHSVTTHHLFSKEIVLYINKPGTINANVNFEKFAKVVNGTGVMASDLIEVFERLTLRQDLRFTTMMPWRSVFSGRSLIRETRAWCSACYEERAKSEQDVYDQLIWSVNAVSICDKHKIPLEIKCPRCTSLQLHLTFRSRPGYCSSCKAWLGSNKQASEARNDAADIQTDTGLSVTIAKWMGALLALTPSLGENITTSIFVTNLSRYLQDRYGGRRTVISRSLSVSPATLYSWIEGRQLPSLGKLLEVCLTLGVPLMDMICVPAEQPKTPEEPTKITRILKTLAKPIRRSDWRKQEVLAGIEKVLRAALEEHPPIPLTRLAAKLVCNELTLRRKFPEITEKLAEKSLAYYRPKMDVKRAGEELRRACSEDPPPSLSEVSKRLGAGYSTASLVSKFPEECELIVTRYESRYRSHMDYDAIGKFMRDSLNEHPPPSLASLCRRLEVAEPNVQRALPELCALIRQRYVQHYQRETAKRRKLLVKEIRSNIKEMLRDGIRPTLSSLSAMRSVPCGSARFYRECQRILGELTSYVKVRA